MSVTESIIAIRGFTVLHTLVNIVLWGAIVMILLRVIKTVLSKK